MKTSDISPGLYTIKRGDEVRKGEVYEYDVSESPSELLFVSWRDDDLVRNLIADGWVFTRRFSGGPE